MAMMSLAHRDGAAGTILWAERTLRRQSFVELISHDARLKRDRRLKSLGDVYNGNLLASPLSRH
jgi:hypothetical protein